VASIASPVDTKSQDEEDFATFVEEMQQMGWIIHKAV